MTETQEKRFMSKVERQPNGCWFWRGTIGPSGYPYVSLNHHLRRAHRVSYEHWSGSLAVGLVVHHECENVSCVNPQHLSAMTQRENILKGRSFQAQNAKKTHCKRGHEFSAENVRLERDGSRTCRACIRVGGRNSARGHRNSQKTRCPRGHSYDGIRTIRGRAVRVCVACLNAQARARRAA